MSKNPTFSDFFRTFSLDNTGRVWYDSCDMPAPVTPEYLTKLCYRTLVQVQKAELPDDPALAKVHLDLLKLKVSAAKELLTFLVPKGGEEKESDDDPEALSRADPAWLKEKQEQVDRKLAGEAKPS